jgi:hypothetical protein
VLWKNNGVDGGGAVRGDWRLRASAYSRPRRLWVWRRVQSTLATQLALYVVLYSPVQMAADLPENYLARPEAFQFIKDVPVDWEVSRTLASVIGDYAVVARQERAGADWYLGAVGDEAGREVCRRPRFPRGRPKL